MTEIRNSKPVLVIGYWNLRFVCHLVLGIWVFSMLHALVFCDNGPRTTNN
jgi:hypothetical protein